MARIDSAIRDNCFARSAVETALLDAQGKRTGLPLSELLGGRRRDALPVAWTLASGDTARDIDEAEQMLGQRRHNVFKLKIGTRPLAQDIAHVAAIKRALGDRGAVRVDVNMAWSELEAARGMAALADAGCELVEQPVASAAALSRLVRRFPVALMADESLTGPVSAFELARVNGADVFAVKIEQSGGLHAAQRVDAIADAAGIQWRHHARGRHRHHRLGAGVRHLRPPAVGYRTVRAVAADRGDPATPLITAISSSPFRPVPAWASPDEDRVFFAATAAAVRSP